MLKDHGPNEMNSSNWEWISSAVSCHVIYDDISLSPVFLSRLENAHKRVISVDKKFFVSYD